MSMKVESVEVTTREGSILVFKDMESVDYTLNEDELTNLVIVGPCYRFRACEVKLLRINFIDKESFVWE